LEPGSCREDPVFGILERGGKVRVEVVQNVTGETLLYMMIMNVNRSGVIYTNKFRIITDSSRLIFVILDLIMVHDLSTVRSITGSIDSGHLLKKADEISRH